MDTCWRGSRCFGAWRAGRIGTKSGTWTLRSVIHCHIQLNFKITFHNLFYFGLCCIATLNGGWIHCNLCQQVLSRVLSWPLTFQPLPSNRHTSSLTSYLPLVTPHLPAFALHPFTPHSLSSTFHPLPFPLPPLTFHPSPLSLHSSYCNTTHSCQTWWLTWRTVKGLRSTP